MMTAEPVTSLWASMASWYTPTSLFLLLNLIIGTIVLTSRFTSRKYPPQPPRDNDPTHHLFRAPSILLERVKSINFNLHRSLSSDNPFATSQHFEEREKTQFVDSDVAPTHQLARVPSLLDRVKSIKFPLHLFENTELEPAPERTDPDPFELKVKAAAKIKKSASAKYGVGRAKEEENVERRRPETMRERGKKRGEEEEECVNEKADDFINRFRQQLKLQRLDSLLQYKDYIQRGSSR